MDENKLVNSEHTFRNRLGAFMPLGKVTGSPKIAGASMAILR
jgi:hypothetical protein